YRSSLNQTMTRHLRATAEHLQRITPLRTGDVVLDIGSNDGTLLSFFSAANELVGIDPTADHFGASYPAHVHRIADFFSAQKFKDVVGGRKAKLVTSIAMVYDLEAPLEFIRELSDILAADGVWHLEQSYLPLMLKRNAYDTICHEHR